MGLRGQRAVQRRIEVELEVRVQVEVELTTQLPMQAKTQFTILAPELLRMLRDMLRRVQQPAREREEVLFCLSGYLASASLSGPQW